MTSFRYKAMTNAGAIVRGRIEAASEAAAMRRLRSDGYYPIWAGQNSSGSLLSGLKPSEPRVSLKSLSLATQELADLMAAGLELDRALDVLAQLHDTKNLKQAFSSVRARVRDGGTLADALAIKAVFPHFYVSMVRAGEISGALGSTLRKLSDYLARTVAIREAITSALVYPIILMVTAALSVSFILTMVLPSFEPLFTSTGHSLPLPTQIALALSLVLRRFWWLGMLGSAVAFLWFRRRLQNQQFRRNWHRHLLRLPLLGQLLAQVELERFKRVLGTLLASGMALPEALSLSHDVLWNTEIAAGIKEAAVSLRQGDSLIHKLSQSRFFPEGTLDLIRVGQETGRLDEMLIRQADLDENHIRHQVDRMIALLVPGLTILLGIVIAGLIASMLVAILSVNDLVLG